MCYKKIFFALLYAIHMPLTALDTDVQDPYHDQAIAVSALIVKKNKRDKKKLQLALGAGALIVAGLGLRYATRATQQEEVDREDDNDEDDLDQALSEPGLDRKHTTKSLEEEQERLKTGEPDPVTLGGDGVPAQQDRDSLDALFSAGKWHWHSKSVSEFFDCIFSLVFTGNYFDLDQILLYHQV